MTPSPATRDVAVDTKQGDSPILTNEPAQLEQHFVGSDVRSRAERPLSAEPRAFLKWAGSKRLVLPQIVPSLPNHFGRYYEPFLGGGSLFFLLRPQRASLSDSCTELIETYRAVRDNPRAVVKYLAGMRPTKDEYYAIRSDRSSGRIKRAAEFIFLNKTCWNGLYRVNARGEFNVPFGRPKTDSLVDTPNLVACAKAMAQPDVCIESVDFEDAVASAVAGDFVFFDPPYVTGHANNGFVDYNEVLFSWDDQRRLAMLAERLRKEGVFVLVTNADHAEVRSLYPGFAAETFSRKSTIASAKAKRTRVTELLFVGKPRG